MDVIVDTTNIERICGGRLRMRFWHSWGPTAGFDALLSTVIQNLSPRSLVVTNTGLHSPNYTFNPKLIKDWVTRILEFAPQGTHFVWHMNDPPGTKKPVQHQREQGREATHTALLNNMKEIDQLQLMFPRHAVDLIGFWNMAGKANEQCSHDMALSSNDGTHYPLPVNEEKGRQLILLIQERCAATRFRRIWYKRAVPPLSNVAPPLVLSNAEPNVLKAKGQRKG